MKNKDLVKRLQRLDPEAEVYFRDARGMEYDDEDSLPKYFPVEEILSGKSSEWIVFFVDSSEESVTL